MLQPCISISSAEVTWYYGQTENSTCELNITVGAKCTLKKEPLNYTNNASCSDLKLYQYEYTGIEADLASYLCHIVTHLELLEDCTVKSTGNNAIACDSGLPVCAYCQSQTNPKCAAQITTTPVLPSTTLLAQSNSTGSASATSEPTPSVPSSINATGCTLGGVSCFVYLAIGLGALVVTVVLLVVVIIVLVHISVKRGKKMRGERECIYTYSTVCCSN